MLLLCTFECSNGADPILEKQAGALLLKQYESVVSARSNALSQLRFYDPSLNFEGKSLGLPFIYMMGGLKAVGPNTYSIVEGDSDVLLTGAKDFVAPQGLGMVTARTCNIAILAPGAAQRIVLNSAR